MRITRQGTGRLVSAVAALGMLVAGLAAPAASATTTDPVYGNIDASKTGSIIIHKHERQTGDTVVSGSPDGTSGVGTKGIKDVTFTVYKVDGLDLATSAGWTNIDKVTLPGSVTADTTIDINGTEHGLTAETTVTTDSDGVATAPGLSVAAYVVVETAHPASVVDTASPFLVTIPYPDSSGTKGWLYDVHVYPKNGQATISKTVDDQTTAGLGLGSTAFFPVTVTVPTLDEDSSFSYFVVKDPMDSKLSNVTVAVSLDGRKITEDEGYFTSGSGNTVVSFTQSGLELLKTKGGKNLVVTFSGTVTSVGTISNTAYLYVDTQKTSTPPDDPEPPANPPSTPSDTVTQNWGALTLHKYDADSGSAKTPLEGAVFEVYAAKTPYPADGTCSSTDTTGDAVSVNGSTTFTSTADGTVTIPGLYVSDSVNGTVNSVFRCYVVKEVTAPAGYVIPVGDKALTAVKVVKDATVSSATPVDVPNSKQTIPGLPLTGSSVMMILVSAGVLVLLGAGVLVVVRRRANR
ncbi:SpaH/EbpB family LPXTG-anchored major pilin [uncultured Bifidobacterium sp.]|uniref:SpaH/EbpB family LPXTG-anchored major pilin n=1 Tax=uncultured Bifidobacterium sp. TaxID=165187 RepID=UPI0028DCB698|nr:SpaH/EbpB family LPXTG-anchored major pilin [uncultured Bifidobacterium sp.]